MIHPALADLAYPIADLSPLEGNPRSGDVAAVARSYERFGQRKPIVARRRDDGTCEVVAGNHQLAAARELGWTTIAVVFTDDDDLTAHAFALADNRASDLGTYDDEALAAMIGDIAMAPDLLAAASYSLDDLDRLNGVEPAQSTGGVQEVPQNFMVVVDCATEREQVAMLRRFMDEGLSVRALMS